MRSIYMKKISAFILLGVTAFSLIGCNPKSGRTFIKLKDGKTLHVGDLRVYKNHYVEDKQDSYVNYEAYVNYTLNRTYSNSGVNYVQYNNYYYYWTKNVTTDSKRLGAVTTKTDVTYSYMSYSKEENIVVRTRNEVTTEYNYKSGFKSFDRVVNVNLNGYFSSNSDLQNLCAELYGQLDLSDQYRIYVSATKRTVVTTNFESYNTYFFIE